MFYLLKEFFISFVEIFIFNKYSNLTKLKNLIKALIAHFITKPERVNYYPTRIYVDPTNICNLKCPLCPTGRKEFGRKPGYMKFDDFKKLIDEIGKYLFQVDFYFWGEPLLNKEIFKMVNYAHQNKIRTRISTNFNFDIEPEKIVESGLDELIVSLDGASDKTYSKYRVGGSFEKVISNIRKLQECKGKMGRANPRITWQFLVFAHNEHEIDKAKKMAKELGVRLRILPIRAGLGYDIILDHKENRFKSWSSKKISRYKENGERKFKIKSCLFLWFQSFVNWDGSISPCCAAFYQKDDFGNAFQNGFMSVWNGEKYRFARYIVKNKIKDYKGFICTNCVERGYFVDP
ncbi:Coenzyme PQQ synthesis protein E [bacterium HR19]|nr:Coenzyme PQQ synthesis protein E [bacterium HR19]